jgi:hypothetical protein
MEDVEHFDLGTKKRLRRVSTVGSQTGQHRVDEGLGRIHCGENCVGLKPETGGSRRIVAQK